MLHDLAPFDWTPQNEEAAVLLATTDRTDEGIATQVGVTRMTLYRWRQHPDFAAKVEAVKSEALERVRNRGIAIKENRVAALDDRWGRMKQVITCRASRYKRLRAATDVAIPSPLSEEEEAESEVVFEGVPEEAETGLVILERTYGKMGVTEKWAVDTGLLAEMRQVETAAAKELNQLTEQVNHSGTVQNGPNLQNLTLEELRQMRALVEKTTVETAVPTGT